MHDSPGGRTIEQRSLAKRVLFATGEFAPVVKVGGLSEASSGLVSELRRQGSDVEVVMPDYGLIDLESIEEFRLLSHDPSAKPFLVRRGVSKEAGPLTLIEFEGSKRPHPYVDPATGHGWPDYAQRFLAFSTAVAALAAAERPDILHCNDWHTAAAIGLAPSDIRTVLTVHNLAYQGKCDAAFAAKLPIHGEAFIEDGRYNPLAGAISLADEVIVVSNTFADEIQTPGKGFGLEQRFLGRNNPVVGIRNGIDKQLWGPGHDVHLPVSFDANDLSGKEICRKELLVRAGLDHDDGPVIGMVSRLVPQKGIDLALQLAPYLEGMCAKLIILGSGMIEIRKEIERIALDYPSQITFLGDFEESLSHLVVAGADLLLIPSRFEPCGLTQMQAMTCGTFPIATRVGGLADTVIDADAHPEVGTGFAAQRPHPVDLLDATHRACRLWYSERNRIDLQRRVMKADWTWREPARRYADIYFPKG